MTYQNRNTKILSTERDYNRNCRNYAKARQSEIKMLKARYGTNQYRSTEIRLFEHLAFTGISNQKSENKTKISCFARR